VVQGHQQRVLALAQPQQGEPEERPVGEVEGAPGLLQGEPASPRLAPGGRQAGEVEHGDFGEQLRSDDLDRLAVAGGEGGAQGLVAAEQLGEDPLQEPRGDLAREPQGRGDVVGRVARLELVEEPEAPLGEGEGEVAVARDRSDGRCRGALVGRLPQRPRHLRDRGRLEDGALGELHRQHLAHPGDHLGGEQRMAAEGEEVVVHAHAVEPQNLGPEAGQQLLGGIGRGHVGVVSGAARFGRREAPAVDLAVGGARQGLQAHEEGGDHVLGQPPAQVGAQLGGVHRGALQIGHQPLLAGGILPGHHHAVARGGVGAQGLLDLSQLDPEAADLDLMVDAAQELQLAVGPEAHQVAGAVGAAPGRPERIGDVPLGGQRGPAEVAAGDPRPGHPQLAGHPRLHQGALAVHHVDPRAEHRPADRGGPLAPRGHQGHGGVGGVLRGAVHVEHPPDRAGRVEPLGEHGRHRLATQPDHPHSRGDGAGAGQLGRGGGDHGGDPDLGGGREGRQVQGVPGQDQPSAPGERHEDLEHRDVEADGGRDQHAAQLVIGKLGAGPVRERHGAAVLDGHPLRAAGRSGGVDHVGEVPLGDPGVRRPGGVRDLLRAEVEHHGAGGKRSAGDQDGGPGILQHVPLALGRVGGIDGHVGGAGREHADQSGDQVGRALQADGHPHLGPGTHLAQAAGDPAGPPGQLAVGQDMRAVHQGHGAGSALRLGGDQLVQTGAPERHRLGLGPGAPLGQELVALGGGEQGDLRDPRLGPRGHAGEQRFQTGHHTVDGGRVEEVQAVLHAAADAFAALPQEQAEIELGVRRGEADPVDLQTRQPEGLVGGVLQGEEDLEDRCVAQAALGGELRDQAVEGHVLVRLGVKQGFMDPRQQLAEGRIPAEVGAQDQGVDEEADQPLGLHLAPSGDRGTHAEVVALGLAVQQGEEAGEQGGEERGPGLAAQGPQLPSEIPGEGPGAEASGRAPPGGPRAVGGELQDRLQAGEPPPPEVELGFQGRTVQCAALPEREVAVLDGQRRQRVGPARRQRGVEDPQLVGEDAERPAVAHDVVHGGEQEVIAAAGAQERGPEDGPPAQVERPVRVPPGEAPDLLLAAVRRQPFQIHHGEGEGRGRIDHLDRMAVADLEAGAQGFVAPADGVEAPAEDLRVQLAGEAEGAGDVVGRAVRLELVDQPEALLGERQRQHVTGLALGRARRDGRDGRGLRALLAEEGLEELALLGRELGQAAVQFFHAFTPSPSAAPPGEPERRRRTVAARG
jgi:hypothetical protein